MDKWYSILVELEEQENLNIYQTAKKHNVCRTYLQTLWKGWNLHKRYIEEKEKRKGIRSILKRMMSFL